MRAARSDNTLFRAHQSNITRKNWQKGIYSKLVKKEQRGCKYDQCRNSFLVSHSDKQKYCSKECWYLTKKFLRESKMPVCLSCGDKVVNRNADKYCSVKCQTNFAYSGYIFRWKQGLENGVRGIQTRVISAHIRRYLKEKYKDKCSLCGWDKVHPITGHVPLEIDHIDGNSENNMESNLRLICPNCHALTPNFRNLNKGKGRSWRLQKLKLISIA